MTENEFKALKKGDIVTSMYFGQFSKGADRDAISIVSYVPEDKRYIIITSFKGEDFLVPVKAFMNVHKSKECEKKFKTNLSYALKTCRDDLKDLERVQSLMMLIEPETQRKRGRPKKVKRFQNETGVLW